MQGWEKTGLVDVLKGRAAAIPPVWFMRQAGRYLPEYRALRAKAGGFLDLCLDPAAASEVTLQPVRRFDLDAAILFADILLIPWALGQKLSFVEGEGPRLDPVVNESSLDEFRRRNGLEELAPVFETVRRTRAALASDKALIGFCGAPWTVATYMLAGGPMRDPSELRGLYYERPDFLRDLLHLLVERSAAYLIAQIDAGADVVQVFESWASGLPPEILEAVSIEPVGALVAAVKSVRPDAPVVVFAKGAGAMTARYGEINGADAVSIDHMTEPGWARAALSPSVAVQGGLDPLAVIAGGATMERAAERILRAFDGAPYVFNLGHGLTPQTPPDHVGALVEFVRSGRWRAKDA